MVDGLGFFPGLEAFCVFFSKKTSITIGISSEAFRRRFQRWFTTLFCSLGFFVALAALGVDLTKVTILAGAFTVGVGFGLQTVINNFVCGLILLFERPIKVGDVVQIDADIGEVRRIGIRACVIRTADGSEVIVPNGTIISNKVTNWTFSDRYRAVEVPVSVARGVAPQRVVEVLKSVAANHPSLAKEPAAASLCCQLCPRCCELSTSSLDGSVRGLGSGAE